MDEKKKVFGMLHTHRGNVLGISVYGLCLWPAKSFMKKNFKCQCSERKLEIPKDETLSACIRLRIYFKVGGKAWLMHIQEEPCGTQKVDRTVWNMFKNEGILNSDYPGWDSKVHGVL